MLDLLKVRLNQGRQYIPDVTAVNLPANFRGLPVITSGLCPKGCAACAEACPTGAIRLSPLAVDLGKCVFCPECAAACGPGAIRFTQEYRGLASTRRDGLWVSAEAGPKVEARAEIRRLFGRSLKLRSVSAGGCNGCELELNALGNVNFDMGRFGIDFVASPRHADGVVITGPVPANMAPALEDTLAAVPEPKVVIAAGACAVSGGVFAGSPALERSFFKRHRVDLFVPGCPPHPLTLIDALLAFLGRR